MEKVRYAIIGFGGIAENRISKEGFGIVRGMDGRNPCAELVGVTDADPRRKITAESLGLKWYDKPIEIFKDRNIEAVFIATNNGSHAKLAESAIEAGKHCIIEKPIATNLKDALHLRELAEKRKKSVIVDHMMKKNVFNIAAKKYIADGVVGNINDIVLHMEFLYGATEDEAKTWRCSNPEELGGPIGDVASHCFYMAEFLLGSPVRQLNCVYLPGSLEIKVENAAFIQFKTISEITGIVRVAFNRPCGGLHGTLTNLGFEIYGSEGLIRSYGTMFQLSGHKEEPVSLKLEVDTSKGVDNFKPAEIKNIYQAVIEEHALSIRSNEPLFPEEGVKNLEEILACHDSAKNGGTTIVLN